MSRVAKLARTGVPFLVSGALLGFLLSQIDGPAVLAKLSPSALGTLIPALLLYGAASLWIEALSLLCVIPASRDTLGLWGWARVKAASYPVYLVNYGLGGAVLSLLVGRRAGVGLAEGAGIVILVAVFDLGMLVLLAAVGATFLATEAPALRAGVALVAGLGFVAGLALLRLPRSLGPLERIRRLSLFNAVRTTPTAQLLRLAALRFGFVASFIGLSWSALLAFDLHVPPAAVIVNTLAVTLVSALPIAVAGLGTSQAAFVYMFRPWGDVETLLACSLTLSAGLIVLRAGLGFAFARELTREAVSSIREAEA